MSDNILLIDEPFSMPPEDYDVDSETHDQLQLYTPIEVEDEIDLPNVEVYKGYIAHFLTFFFVGI